MSCDTYRRKILDRDWTEHALREAAEINAHLATCSECREALAGYDLLRDDLGSDPAQGAAEPADEFDPAVMLTRRRVQQSWPRLALAASAVLALSGWLLYLQQTWSTSSAGEPGRRMVTNPSPAGGQRSIQLTADDVQQQVQMFANVAEVFEGRARWVATADDNPDLGLAASPIGASTKVVLMRLVMSHGRQIVSDANLVIVPGESASLIVPFGDGHKLRYRIETSRQEPRTLSVWAELQRSGGGDEALAALGTTLRPRGNQVMPAGRMVTSSGGYELEIAFSEAELPHEP